MVIGNNLTYFYSYLGNVIGQTSCFLCMMFFVIFLSSRFCISIYTLILLKIMNNPVLYFISFSKMKTAPVKKRPDCLMRQDQKVLFI